MAAPSRVPWTRRLDVRLAVLMAVLMLLFAHYEERLGDAAYWVLDEPHPSDTFLDKGSEFAERLLRNAKRESDGSWAPDQRDVDMLGKARGDWGEAWVWLDGNNQVVVASPQLPWRPGDTWHQVLGDGGRIDVPGMSEPRRFYTAVLELRHQVLGTLVSLLMDEELHARRSNVSVDDMLDSGAPCRYADDAVVLSDAQRRAQMERYEFVTEVMGWLTSGLTALFVAFIVSRLVTRRLSRLSDMVSGNVPPGESLPGPFPTKGSDEIGALSRALQSMRGRVGELVEGLAERDELRREWIAQVSHDLRTPLTALMAVLDRADLLLERSDAPTELRLEMERLVNTARLDADRVKALADDLLDIARLDADAKLAREPVPPGELVRQTLTELEPIAEARGVTLHAEVAPQLPVLHADGRRLMRAMENLVRNAIEYARHDVRVRALNGNGYVTFEVTDDGPGFPAASSPRTPAGEVTEAAPAGDVDLEAIGQRRNRAGSAGLGLIVTRRMTEAHNGTMSARNLEHGGSSVLLQLPVSSEIPEESAPAAASDPAVPTSS